MINREIIQYEIVGQYKVVQIKEKLTEVVDGQVVDYQPAHRRCIAPGEDYSNESDEIKAICGMLHTQEVVDEYAQMQAELD